MTNPARPWILALFALPVVACGGSTTSTPPGPQPLETDGGADPDTALDAAAGADVLNEEDAETIDPKDAAPDVEEVSCPGWIAPDETASCSQNSMNNQCSANCRSGTRTWRSQCQDGSCTCSLGIDVSCTCEMKPGTCQSCCPGMAR